MKKLFFILIFSIFFASSSLSSECDSIAFYPKIEMFSSYGKLQYDTSKNISQITDIANKYGLIEKNLFASGLATVDISTDISTETIGQPQKNGMICVYPTKVRLFLGFSNPLIYISNTLKPKSCEYNVVLRHEQTHQFINKEMLDYFLPLFRTAITQIVINTPPIQISSINQVDEASRFLTEEYNKQLLPLVDFFKQEMIYEQRHLDNTQNYIHEKSLCL